MELASAALFALHPYLAIHEMDQPMADGQTETGAAESARGGGICPGKGFEDGFAFVGGNTDAGVAHDEMKQNLKALQSVVNSKTRFSNQVCGVER
jgi:hypothetical protein